MSLFSDQETTCRWYQYSDSDTTKISSVNLGGSYTSISANIIRIGDVDSIIEGDILGEYRANVDTSGISRGDLIYKSASEIYQVVRDPRYNKLFNKYHLNLKRVV